MSKSAAPHTTCYTFMQRTDLALASRTADLLAHLALRAEALRRKLKNEDFRKMLADYAFVSVMCLLSGALCSLLTAWFS